MYLSKAEWASRRMGEWGQSPGFMVNVCGYARGCRESQVTVPSGRWPTALPQIKPAPEAALEVFHKCLASAGSSALGRVSQTRSIRLYTPGQAGRSPPRVPPPDSSGGN